MKNIKRPWWEQSLVFGIALALALVPFVVRYFKAGMNDQALAVSPYFWFQWIPFLTIQSASILTFMLYNEWHNPSGNLYKWVGVVPFIFLALIFLLLVVFGLNEDYFLLFDSCLTVVLWTFVYFFMKYCNTRVARGNENMVMKEQA